MSKTKMKHDNTHVFTDTDILNIIAHKGRFMVHWRDTDTVRNCKKLVADGVLYKDHNKRANEQGKHIYKKCTPKMSDDEILAILAKRGNFTASKAETELHCQCEALAAAGKMKIKEKVGD